MQQNRSGSIVPTGCFSHWSTSAQKTEVDFLHGEPVLTDRSIDLLLVISVSFSIAEVSPMIIELLRQIAEIIVNMLLLGVRRKW